MLSTAEYQLTGKVEVNECFQDFIPHLPFVNNVVINPCYVDIDADIYFRNSPLEICNCWAVEFVYDQKRAQDAGISLQEYEWIADFTEEKQGFALQQIIQSLLNLRAYVNHN